MTSKVVGKLRRSDQYGLLLRTSQIPFFLPLFLLTASSIYICLLDCYGFAGVVCLVDELWNENLIVQKWVTVVYENGSWSRRRILFREHPSPTKWRE